MLLSIYIHYSLVWMCSFFNQIHHIRITHLMLFQKFCSNYVWKNQQKCTEFNKNVIFPLAKLFYWAIYSKKTILKFIK